MKKILWIIVGIMVLTFFTINVFAAEIKLGLRAELEKAGYTVNWSRENGVTVSIPNEKPISIDTTGFELINNHYMITREQYNDILDQLPMINFIFLNGILVPNNYIPDDVIWNKDGEIVNEYGEIIYFR